MQAQVPLHVYIPPRARGQGSDGASQAPAAGQAPFLSQPPPFWRPQTVHGPTAWEVGSAPPLPADAVRAGALQGALELMEMGAVSPARAAAACVLAVVAVAVARARAKAAVAGR